MLDPSPCSQSCRLMVILLRLSVLLQYPIWAEFSRIHKRTSISTNSDAVCVLLLFERIVNRSFNINSNTSYIKLDHAPRSGKSDNYN